MKEMKELLPVIKAEYIKAGISLEQVNIIGVRFSEDQEKDIWNDLIGLFIPDQTVYLWAGTTDPGRKATLKQEGGAAHLCPGFHENIWVLDNHPRQESLFQHLALCSRPEFGCQPTRIWRDTNKDYMDNDNHVQTGFFGINCHRASKQQDVEYIGDYSAGCQVTRNIKDFEFLLSVILGSDKCKQNPRCLWSYFLFDHTVLGI